MKYPIELEAEAWKTNLDHKGLKKLTSTSTLDNLLKDPVWVKFDLLPNHAADVFKDNSKKMAGVEVSKVSHSGLLGSCVADMGEVFVHIRHTTSIRSSKLLPIQLYICY